MADSGGAASTRPGSERAGVTVSLAGRVVLVTGAGRGIGRAIASACGAAGADVAVTWHTSHAGAEQTVAAIRAHGQRAEAFQADVTQAAAVEALASAAQRTFGRVDVWINNAGADVLTGAARALSWTEKLDRLLAVDLRGTVLGSWAAVALMRAQEGGGTILNVAWDQVLGGGVKGEYAEIFCATKGGVYSFSRALARAVAPDIRVNVLGPGWVETAWGEGLEPAAKARLTEGIPLKRWARPDEIANAAVFLSSDHASYITGQMLLVNGGAVI